MGSYKMVNLLPRCDKNDNFIGSNSLVVYSIMSNISGSVRSYNSTPLIFNAASQAIPGEVWYQAGSNLSFLRHTFHKLSNTSSRRRISDSKYKS